MLCHRLKVLRISEHEKFKRTSGFSRLRWDHHSKRCGRPPVRHFLEKREQNLIKRIPDEIEKDTYVKRLANELLVDESSILATLKNISLPKEKRKKIDETKKIKNHDFELERNTLGLLSIFPNYLDFAESLLDPKDFTQKETSNFYKKMLKYVSEKKDFSESKFLSSLKKGEDESFKHYILAAEANFSDLDEERKAEEIYFSVKRIKKNSLTKQKEALSAQIRELEKSKNKKGANKALKDLNKVLSEEQKIS